MSEQHTYEQAYYQLETIVNQIESGEISVDILTQRLKEAKHLLEICRDKLQKAEEEIRSIEQTEEKTNNRNKTAGQ